jgi:hypothetical protein
VNGRVKYKLSATVEWNGEWCTVTVECNGFVGSDRALSVDSAFRRAHEECMARMAEGVSA